MNYQASLGAPCDNYERFIFGRGPSGQAEACHFPPPNQFPAATTGYWIISYALYGVQQNGVRRNRVRKRRHRPSTDCPCCVWGPKDGSRGGSPGQGSSRPPDNLGEMRNRGAVQFPVPRWAAVRPRGPIAPAFWRGTSARASSSRLYSPCCHPGRRSPPCCGRSSHWPDYCSACSGSRWPSGWHEYCAPAMRYSEEYWRSLVNY